jgi:YidC/Oxa1 family membrane protein insertase
LILYNRFMELWTELLLKPIFNLLVFLYNSVPGQDLGVAIILMTLLIKVVLYPLNKKSIISQRALQKVQPKIDEIKEKFKDSREKLGSEMMALYKKEKINPLSSCLPLLVQLPILIAVFQVLRNLGGEQSLLLYPFVTDPGALKTMAFGFLDLSIRSIPLAILAGGAQFWQTKMLMNKREQAAGKGMASMMQKQMLYMMPIFTVVIGSTFPAGLTLYWLATTVFSGLQQVLMIKRGEVEKAS